MTQPNDKEPRRWDAADIYWMVADEAIDPKEEYIRADDYDAKCAELEEAYKDRNHWRGIYMGSPTSSLHRMIDKLRAEVERLRAALIKIESGVEVIHQSNGETATIVLGPYQYGQIASEALAADAGKKGGSGE